jgi:hypothetical protein
MLDAVTNSLTRAIRATGRGIARAIGVVVSPFERLGRWYLRRGWILRAIVGAILVGVLGLYGYFFWNTQRWSSFDPDYVAAYDIAAPSAATGQPAAAGAPQSCQRSHIVEVTAELVDFNVNQNAWISSMILYKLGFFGLDWERTPFFDNKASFQRGVNQAVRRTAIELVDMLGRVRGTSQVDQDLQNARGNLQFDEYSWYFGLSPFGPKTPTPSYYRSSVTDLRAFNDRLAGCQAVFDARADNLLQFVDRIANDIGATSAILRDRSEQYNGGWFDTRADDRFWFAYGQLYGYYGILAAARADFHDVLAQRGLGPLWSMLEDQLRAALRVRPFIISNGAESGWLMPSHLATMGFYVLRVRSNLVEVRLVLDR